MKKQIFSTLIALAATVTVAANAAAGISAGSAPVNMLNGDILSSLQEIRITPDGSPVNAAVPVSRAAAEDDVTLDFHYCGSPKGSMATGDAGEVENSAAILLPESVVNRYAGSEIVSVMICSGVNMDQYAVNNITDATLFLNHDIFNEEHFMTQRGRLSRSSHTWSEIKLNTPYKLETGKPVYIGYTVVRPTNADCPVTYDRTPVESDCSFWMNYSLDGERRWENWAPLYGSLCMHVILRGSDIPVNDVEVLSLNVPSQVNKGAFDISFDVKNVGANEINSVSYTCSVNSRTPLTKQITLDPPLQFSDSRTVTVNLACYEYGQDLPVTVSVTEVNGGQDSDMSNNTLTKNLLCLDPAMGYDRVMVMEEGTGLWCPNCPRGLTSMEYMLEKYPGRFIGIGAHFNDPMDAKQYAGNNYQEQFAMIPAYPSARYNRIGSYGNSINDFGDQVESIYRSVISMPAVAKIDADIYFTDESRSEINVETTSEFALNNKVPYRISLVLIENGVGPYPQQNGYAGASYDCAGWEKLGSAASVMFNDVMRYTSSYQGVSGIFPEQKVAKTAYSYNATLPVEPLSSIKDFNVVALLINGSTGVIENAVMCNGNENLGIKPFDSSSLDGVQAVAATARVVPETGGVKILGNYGSAVVYGTGGVAVAVASGSEFISLPAGLYIVVVDGAVTKVMVR